MKKCNYYRGFDIKVKLNNTNIQKIIDFYLFNCSVPNTSARSKTFNQLGWTQGYQFVFLKQQMLSVATESLKNNFSLFHYEDGKQLLNTINDMDSVTPTDEYCVFLLHEKRKVFESLFKAIRNALAHGSFNVKHTTM